MKKIIKKLFFQGDTWKIAYRVTKSNILEDLTTPFTILQLPRGYWGADPFLFEQNGKIYIFFELTDYKKRKSVLACKELFNESKKINIIYEFAFHCSYPCIFKYKENIYIIPETVQNSEVILLKCKEFPFIWKYEKKLFTNYKSVDSTIRQSGNKLYLLTYDVVNNKFATDIYELNNKLNPTQEPIHSRKDTYDIHRPAGHFIEIGNNEYLRPVQPSNNYYGEKIVFLKGGSEWKEEEVASISIKDIALDRKKKKKYIGLHTYNKSGFVEVIDIAEMSFRPFKVLEFIFRKLRLFGYGLYDKSGKNIAKKLNSKYFKNSLD